MKKCRRCHDSSVDGVCSFCEGKGRFPKPDLVALSLSLVGRNGLRCSPPPVKERNTIVGARRYYLWRMTRWNGGVDTSMPMIAELLAMGDPYTDELEKHSRELARNCFGTDLGAVKRWLPLLGEKA